MFFAPCTLPIVPGYLAFIAGVPVGEQGQAHPRAMRRRVLLNATAFVLGFSVIFVFLGVFASSLGALLGPFRPLLSHLSGFVIILFGLTMLGVVRLPLLAREWHTKIPHFLLIGRWESSLFIGALFALGWSPCVGPILGSVLLLASIHTTVLQGALLLAVFSVGLGIPFLVTAALIGTAGQYVSRWGAAARGLSIVGGVALVLVGIFTLSGDMPVLTSYAYRLLESLGYDRLLLHV